MSGFLHKQGDYLLNNELYALISTTVLALIPFTTWLSLSVIALITLRKGSYNGFKVLLAGVIAAIIISNQNVTSPYAICQILITFSLGYISAIVLRVTASWKIVATFVLIITLITIFLIHWLIPGYVIEQFKALFAMLRTIEQGEELVQLLLNTKQESSSELLANYLLGIKGFSIVLSALSSLMLARYIQSLLFYPGGFRQEMLTFRANRIGVLLLAMSALGTYQDNPFAVSCLPVLVIYLMTAGMSLFFNVIARKKDLITILLLLMPLIIAPYVMLPFYVFFGSLDSLFNLRLILQQKR